MGSVFFKSSKEKLAKTSKSFFELQATDIDGKTFEFSSLSAFKAIIVVNVASSCGLTRTNYKELNELYEKYK